ncbi:putative integrase [Streptomyces davaonensis JCM 4913]|uniref:Putative integrase n=1 Tax=Streptomyces davaonensis (strain DSM 101723 / JCM 4913 / KCC S-0913 / 768) TaxID=1214101 RepID=K4RGX3_STRDJ|nr:recombinase family protein [Streptomyces davaonensis]CCK32614.1 putative integrase [Streptomyces davaonensis JCM 4913]
MSRAEERPFDGCGLCFVGVRRLSRRSDATWSPARQRDNVLSAVASVGGHVIAWADDWEVSGATNPIDRPRLGPWLRGEKGPYAGIAGAAVDRIGRSLVDCLNTGYKMRDEGKLLVTYGHSGPWDLNDPADENQFIAQAWGAQMELRATEGRNRDETVKAREQGRKRGKHSYGYRYVRLYQKAAIDHVALDRGEDFPEEIRERENAAENIRDVARRILADHSGEITEHSEAARLTRAGVLSPVDHERVMGGKEPRGSAWGGSALRSMLISEAALGYLLHKDKPVLDDKGMPVRVAPPLWNRETHEALVKKLARKKPRGKRAQSGTHLLSSLAICGQCKYRQYRTGNPVAMTCMSRRKGLTDCQPSPTIYVERLEEALTGWFLATYGDHKFMERVFDPGNGVEEELAEKLSARNRLRDDRNAGLYDDEDDAAWYRERYGDLTAEIKRLRETPIRPAGMIERPTGETVASKWHAAADDGERRQLLHEFGVTVEVFPEGHTPRWRPLVDGKDPDAGIAASMSTSTAG